MAAARVPTGVVVKSVAPAVRTRGVLSRLPTVVWCVLAVVWLADDCVCCVVWSADDCAPAESEHSHGASLASPAAGGGGAGGGGGGGREENRYGGFFRTPGGGTAAADHTVRHLLPTGGLAMLNCVRHDVCAGQCALSKSVTRLCKIRLYLRSERSYTPFWVVTSVMLPQANDA